MKGFGIYVQNDLLEPKHHKAMGQSIWLYLWCLDKITAIKEDGSGLILGGKPIKLEEVNADLSLSDRTYTRYLERLQEYGYITATRTPYGYVIKVAKAKKQFGKKIKRTVKVAPRTVKVAGENRKSGGNKEDNTEDNTEDNKCEPSGSAKSDLKTKNKDMAWNTTSDDFAEDISIDLDGDGTLEEKKPQTRKYPNAPAVRKIFQEVLGKSPAAWKQNKNQLLACENLYTERGMDKIKSALLFYKEHQQEEYCPKIHSPHCLDSKWTKLGEYKLNL